MPHDKIKAAIRQRMADTGESYAEARRQVLAPQGAAFTEPSLSTVFAEPKVLRDGPLGQVEPNVNFLLESTRPVAAKGRETINDWYSRFPDSDGKFRDRLRSPKGTAYEVAQDELFVHERLVGRARVSYEEGGVGPDFRIYQGTGYLGAIEVLSLFMTRDWSDQHNQHGRIADELNKRLTLDKWFVSFEIKQLDQNLSFTRLAGWVDRTISHLPDRSDANDNTYAESYAAQGVKLEFTFTRCKPNPTGGRDRIVGPGPVIGGLVTSGERLLVALAGKAGGRYELRNAPFAVCVGVHDPFCSLDQLESAIYGRVHYEYEVGGSGEVNRSRAQDGFFGRTPGYPGGKNRRVSCVFAMNNWVPWNPEKLTVLRFDNPFADYPFPENLFPADARVARVDRDGPGFAFDWVPGRPSDF
jgi:hypothetical protein